VFRISKDLPESIWCAESIIKTLLENHRVQILSLFNRGTNSKVKVPLLKLYSGIVVMDFLLLIFLFVINDLL